MIDCNLVKVDRVVCEDTFSLWDVEKMIPIQIPLPPGSKIDPAETFVKVTVVECALHKIEDTFYADLILMINKDITITPPEGPDIFLEYSFQKKFPALVFCNCCYDLLSPNNINKLYCQVFDLETKDTMSLDLENNSFSEVLVIKAVIKVVYAEQIPIPLPPKPPPICHVPKRVLVCLEIVAGKIRAQVSNLLLKKKLLEQIKQIQKLLNCGCIMEALVLLMAIQDHVQHFLNMMPCHKTSFNLVLGDLTMAREELLTYFSKVKG